MWNRSSGGNGNGGHSVPGTGDDSPGGSGHTGGLFGVRHCCRRCPHVSRTTGRRQDAHGVRSHLRAPVFPSHTTNPRIILACMPSRPAAGAVALDNCQGREYISFRHLRQAGTDSPGRSFPSPRVPCHESRSSAAAIRDGRSRRWSAARTVCLTPPPSIRRSTATACALQPHLHDHSGVRVMEGSRPPRSRHGPSNPPGPDGEGSETYTLETAS
jgi:hypothetical protein